ncbi:MAG: hemolysin family protein [Candidatus Cloacimonadia bacterium]|jgi:CBS domain containing-hemolysin-like protein
MESDPSKFSIIILLLLSAYFSASETAFFSLGKLHLKKLESEKGKTSRRTARLLKKPQELLITILLGNTIVNVWASTLAAICVANYFLEVKGWETLPVWLIILQTIGMTLLLLFFGEIIPKLFALAKADAFARKSGFFIEFLMYLLFPLIALLLAINRIFSPKTAHHSTTNQGFTSQDLKNLVDSNSVNHPLHDNERMIISGIFKSISVDAKKIMVPRVDIKGICIDEKLDNIKEQILKYGHSRIPVYKNNIDTIVGFIYVKDLILNPGLKNIGQILRKPIFITGNTKTQTLFNLFRAKKTHLAIVVDEYGGTSGLITLEDILEEYVGEIVDEYDTEKPMVEKINDLEYQVSGMLSIFDLNEITGCNVDEEKYDNLAAFLYDIFNRVPEVNEEIEYDDTVTFIITTVKGQRIETVRILLNEDKEEFEF